MHEASRRLNSQILIKRLENYDSTVAVIISNLHLLISRKEASIIYLKAKKGRKLIQY